MAVTVSFQHVNYSCPFAQTIFKFRGTSRYSTSSNLLNVFSFSHRTDYFRYQLFSKQFLWALPKNIISSSIVFCLFLFIFKVAVTSNPVITYLPRGDSRRKFANIFTITV